MKKQNDDITLKGLLDIFLPKIWAILLVAFVCAALLGSYSYFGREDTYTAKGKYMVAKVNYSDGNAQTGLTTSEIAAMQGMISNFKEIINTKKFATQVIEKLGRDDISTNYIRSMMRVSLGSSDTTCYYFSATSTDPELANDVARVAGQLLIDSYKETKYAIEFKILEDPELPTARDSKNVAKNTIIGFAGGFLVSALVVFVLSRFDVLIRSKEKIEDNFDIPILGVIPRLESAATGRSYGLELKK